MVFAWVSGGKNIAEFTLATLIYFFKNFPGQSVTAIYGRKQGRVMNS
jgi:hypothetical protein